MGSAMELKTRRRTERRRNLVRNSNSSRISNKGLDHSNSRISKHSQVHPGSRSSREDRASQLGIRIKSHHS